jgi:hypothetical protein
MGRTAHHYFMFETAGGFCGIAWNKAGITRFQLPAKSAEATQRMLLRRAPGAESGAPPPEVAEAVAAVKRYFEGEEEDFSGFKLDLGEQDPPRLTLAGRRPSPATLRWSSSNSAAATPAFSWNTACRGYCASAYCAFSPVSAITMSAR